MVAILAGASADAQTKKHSHKQAGSKASSLPSLKEDVRKLASFNGSYDTNDGPAKWKAQSEFTTLPKGEFRIERTEYTTQNSSVDGALIKTRLVDSAKACWADLEGVSTLQISKTTNGMPPPTSEVADYLMTFSFHEGKVKHHMIKAMVGGTLLNDGDATDTTDETIILEFTTLEGMKKVLDDLKAIIAQQQLAVKVSDLTSN